MIICKTNSVQYKFIENWPDYCMLQGGKWAVIFEGREINFGLQ